MNLKILGSADLPRLIARDIAEQPADSAWRSRWAPRLSYGRHRGPAPRTARRASIAILLCRVGPGWSIPLTLRSDQLARHRGQVSFPGGIVDDPESPEQAARREVAEELGQSPRIDWLGRFSELYVFASDAVVTPCVGTIDHWPQWIANPAEVAEIIRLPLVDMLQRGANTMIVRRGPLRFSAPYLDVEGRRVWGSTAILLGELRGRLQRLADIGFAV